MRLTVIGFVIAAAMMQAAPALAIEFTCEQARWYAQHYSRETLEMWGKLLGITDAEREKARACIEQRPRK